MRQKVVVGWPDGGSTLSVFTESLINLFRLECTSPSPDYEVLAPARMSSVYVQDNRNELVEAARREGADWLLQLDSDNEFRPELLRTLMKAADPEKRPIVVGLYANVSTGDGGSFQVVDHIFAEVETGEYSPLVPPEDLQPFQVDAAGTGVFLTHLSIFDRITPPWFWLEKIQLSNGRVQTINEDLAFCRLAREAGYQIWCAPLAEVIHWKRLPLVSSNMRVFLRKAGDVREELKLASG